MTSAPHPPSRHVTAMALALGGFALLPVGDAIVKSMTGLWPGTSISAARYLFGALITAALLYREQGLAGFRCPRPGIQAGRAISVSVSAACFFAGVQVMPLAEMTAISFTSPIITAIMSAAFLKEPAPRAVWVAAAIATVGMLLVLRPNVASIGLAGVLPLISAMGFSALIIFNRMVAGSGSVMQMQFLISAMSAPFLIVVALVAQQTGLPQLRLSVPDWSVVARCAALACSATLAHTLLFKATERVSAARTAPLVYVQLLVALVLGIIFFNDIPDMTSAIGAAIIVGAGLLLWRRSPTA